MVERVVEGVEGVVAVDIHRLITSERFRPRCMCGCPRGEAGSERECEVEGYLAHKNPPSPQDPTVALYLGTCGDPRGVGLSYERGTPVGGGEAPPPESAERGSAGADERGRKNEGVGCGVEVKERMRHAFSDPSQKRRGGGGGAEEVLAEEGPPQ